MRRKKTATPTPLDWPALTRSTNPPAPSGDAAFAEHLMGGDAGSFELWGRSGLVLDLPTVIVNSAPSQFAVQVKIGDDWFVATRMPADEPFVKMACSQKDFVDIGKSPRAIEAERQKAEREREYQVAVEAAQEARRAEARQKVAEQEKRKAKAQKAALARHGYE